MFSVSCASFYYVVTDHKCKSLWTCLHGEPEFNTTVCCDNFMLGTARICLCFVFYFSYKNSAVLHSVTYEEDCNIAKHR